MDQGIGDAISQLPYQKSIANRKWKVIHQDRNSIQGKFKCLFTNRRKPILQRIKNYQWDINRN